MDVKIDAEAMSAVVSRAILEGVSSEQRDLLLEQAVKALVTPPQRESWRAGPPDPTPLQGAFDRAAQTVVNKVAMEMVGENEEFAQRVRELVGEAISVAADRDYDLKAKIGCAVADALIDWKQGR